MGKISKAVIAVAGYGTRFLPATKVVPKELMPIVDKPVVQYLVEEAVGSGITDIIFVTRPGTQTIADHFDTSRELEIHLEEQQKMDYLRIVQALPKLANFAFVRQGRHLPYGNGSPILAAKEFLGREPFVYMFGDDIIMADTPCVRQMLDVFEEHEPAAMIAVQVVRPSESNRYGMVKLKPNTHPLEMESIVEKPPPDRAPSNLAQFGRFILTPRVIEILERRELGIGNELFLTDAIDKLSREATVLVQQIQGTWYTIGDPLRYLITTVEHALRHPEIGVDFATYLRSLDWEQFRGAQRA